VLQSGRAGASPDDRVGTATQPATRGTWGLSLPNRGPLIGLTTVDELLELARVADGSGFFESVWIGDSLLDRPRVESVAMLGALAGLTHRVRIGVSCFASLVVRHPIELAIQLASVDVISKGRLTLVACLGGGVARELDPFGVARATRVARVEEGLGLIRRLWTEAEVTHEGRFFRFNGVRAEPRPVQRPHPPIWYAVTPDDERLSPMAVDRALGRAIRYADGWQGADTDPEQIGRLCRRVRELRGASAGARDPDFPCSTHVHVTIADRRAEAWDVAKGYFQRYYPHGFFRDYADPEALIRRFHTWGSPEECAEGLLRYAAAGCSTVIVRFAAPGQAGQLRRFLGEVAPLLTARWPRMA